MDERNFPIAAGTTETPAAPIGRKDAAIARGAMGQSLPMQQWLSMITAALGKIFEKLPAWAKLIWAAVGIVASVYLIREYGLFHFILRLIFSP